EPRAQGRRVVVEARVSELLAREAGRVIAVRDPVTLSFRGLRERAGVRVEKLALKTAFLDATGSGDLERGIAVSAAFDRSGVQLELRELIDFGAIELAGRGRLAADLRRAGDERYAGRLAAEIRGARFAGWSSTPVERKLIRLDATATGPIGV